MFSETPTHKSLHLMQTATKIGPIQTYFKIFYSFAKYS